MDRLGGNRIRCLALLSGGTDSMVAARLMQEQQIDVEGLHFETIFTDATERAQQVAQRLQVPLHVVRADADYLDVIRQPRFGYGRAANPCVDCRIHLFRYAEAWRRDRELDFVVSGEILGQTRDGQKRRDLEWIAHHSQLGDRLLRPLSALQLPATWPEQQGMVDRSRLFDFSGSSRKEVFRLARQLQLPIQSGPQNSCALTDAEFGRKVFDLLRHERSASEWAFALLRVGRHLRYKKQTKLVLGRHRDENEQLVEFFRSAPDARSCLLTPDDFPGPNVLVVGECDDRTLGIAFRLLRRHARRFGQVRLHREGQSMLLTNPS